MGEKKWLCFTFDDGPNPVTNDILDVLLEYDAKATFFTLGSSVTQYPDILRRTIALGHEIATHTQDHPHLTELSPEAVDVQIQGGLDALSDVTNATVRFMRPPYGEYDAVVQECCRRRGLLIGRWTVTPDDWRGEAASILAGRILDSARDGCVYVCHDWQARTAEALAMVLPGLVRDGYKMVTLSEMMARFAPETLPGMPFPA